MRKICAVLIVLACTSLANASVIGTWDDGVAVTNAGFTGTRYTLTLTSDEGLISAIDLKIVATDYFYNEQYREGRIFKSGPASSYDVDTCFLFLSSGLTIVKSGEDDVTPPDEEWLKTSNLYAAFSFTNGVGSFASAPVLQVIVPTGVTPTLADLWNTNDSLNKAYVVAGGKKVAITPEPATLSLIGLGGLALLRRRRK